MSAAPPAVTKEKNKKEKAQTEQEPKKKEPALSSDEAGIYLNDDPAWSLVADAQVTSLDLTKPVAGLGLKRATPLWIFSAAFKKNLSDNSIEAGRGSKELGRAILSPSLSSFSFVLRGEKLWTWAVCSECEPVPKYHTKRSLGGYAQLEAANAKFRATNVAEEDLTIAAASVGAILRIEGQMPEGARFGTNKLLLAPFVGATARIVGSGSKMNREAILGTSDRDFWGFEVGALGQLGNLALELKLTALTNHEKDGDAWVGTRVPGLTGVEIQVNFSFLLPWSVLGCVVH